MGKHTKKPTNGSVDSDEVERFAKLADQWWDPRGEFKSLHRLNPVRLEYVRDRLAALYDRDPLAPQPLQGLRLLDVGCGGGLVSEPLTRLGAQMVGIDPAEQNIAVARRHAERNGLAIDYRHATAEALSSAGERFDALLALEILEHVADIEVFAEACEALIKPGGGFVFATLNRTLRSFTLAIVGAEYLMGWLPRGTHQWSRFVRPAEIVRLLRRHGLSVRDLSGVGYRPIVGEWELGRDLSVNYMGFAEKPAA